MPNPRYALHLDPEDTAIFQRVDFTSDGSSSSLAIRVGSYDHAVVYGTPEQIDALVASATGRDRQVLDAVFAAAATMSPSTRVLLFRRLAGALGMEYVAIEAAWREYVEAGVPRCDICGGRQSEPQHAGSPKGHPFIKAVPAEVRDAAVAAGQAAGS